MRPDLARAVFIVGLFSSAVAVSAAGRAWGGVGRGPVFSESVESHAAGRQVTPKGVVVRLDDGHAFVVFDTDLLRYSVGWVGDRCIDWRGVDLDGTHRAWPKVVGEEVFGTANAPGWGHGGSF